MKNPKKTKNLIWLIIQLINVVFQIIRAITNTDGQEFFDDLEEVIDMCNPKNNQDEPKKEGKTDSEIAEESC